MHKASLGYINRRAAMSFKSQADSPAGQPRGCAPARRAPGVAATRNGYVELQDARTRSLHCRPRSTGTRGCACICYSVLARPRLERLHTERLASRAGTCAVLQRNGHGELLKACA